MKDLERRISCSWAASASSALKAGRATSMCQRGVGYLTLSCTDLTVPWNWWRRLRDAASRVRQRLHSLDTSSSEHLPACSPVREAQQPHKDEAEGAEGQSPAKPGSRLRRTDVKELSAGASKFLQDCACSKASGLRAGWAWAAGFSAGHYHAALSGLAEMPRGSQGSRLVLTNIRPRTGTL